MASRNAIFGSAPDAADASPGTYGEPPKGFRLPSETRLGAVRLQVADLSRSLEFYQGVLGFREVAREDASSSLAARGDDRPIIELHERSGAKPAPRRGRLGLFHFAILLPERGALGSFLQHLAGIDVMVGSSDHLVSEALYLQDPDNLGIEVYADRPRSSWKRVGRELMMATDPLDVGDVIAASRGVPWTGMPEGTTIGHVHLHVGDIPAAAAFYSDGIGFDRIVWHYPGALFLSAGGYHHHLGTNTWAGPTATPAGPDDARLLEWTIWLPDEDRLTALGENLEASGIPVEKSTNALTTRDPWGTQVRAEVQP